jgi:hypothetical protein
MARLGKERSLGLNNQQTQTLEIMERLKNAVDLLATSSGEPKVRLLNAWQIVDSIRTLPIYLQTPNEFQSRIENLEKRLTRFGELNSTMHELTPDEVSDLIRSILSLDADHDRLIKPLFHSKPQGN